ncbi:CoA transferase [Streptomyces sp. ID05-04B]|uniref:CoA transferase n=1 Tax=unclassified Streptomyces TaxID=2593676 RepID=UPI00131F2F37|nr:MULTISPECIES: CoA transferase [unclassified Streptomyces]MDX5562889.1 CoA transferase [Streptomyces sp. ID05-04B]
MKNATLARWAATVEGRLGPLAAVADDFTALTGVPVELGPTLFERALAAGFRLPGGASAGGSCHLLATSDGWAAVNLARPDDHAALPALLGLLGAPRADLRTAARGTSAAELVTFAQTLGIAAAELGADRGERPPVRAKRYGPDRRRELAGLRVVDLSALWAGPLCARLLGLAGARVVKVESHSRPDGARFGPADFYHRLHQGHESLVLDFASGALAEVVAEADLVVEASRPRALRRLGVRAEEFLAGRPGRVWVSITGYGRDDDRIAFGDDAAVSGGLTGLDRHGDPVFLGDALGDPVTGVYAAHAAARSLERGGGELLSVSMSACTAAQTHASAVTGAAGPKGAWGADPAVTRPADPEAARSADAAAPGAAAPAPTGAARRRAPAATC